MIYSDLKFAGPKPDDYAANTAWAIKQFDRCNVLIEGPKGAGKDVFTSHIIHSRSKRHYSNIIYSRRTERRPLSDLNHLDLTFEQLVAGEYEKVDPIFDKECDFYISDAGIYLPAQEHQTLCKIYSGMVVFFAVSRHLYNMNIHCNTQNIERVWDKLREQSDFFIRIIGNTLHCKNTWSDHFVIETLNYSKYDAAKSGVLPPPIGTERRKLLEFYSAHGLVEYRLYKVYLRDIHYDTHFFRGELLNGQDSQKSWQKEILSQYV